MSRRVATAHIEALGTAVVFVLTVALVATSTGRNTLAWIYLQSHQAVEHSVPVPFLLDRFNPAWPQRM